MYFWLVEMTDGLVHVLGCSRKNPHTPLTDGILEILAGAGSKTLEIQAGGGLN